MLKEETVSVHMAQTRAYHGSVATVLFLLLQLFRCLLLGPGLLGREYNDLNVLSDSETEQTRPVYVSDVIRCCKSPPSCK